MTEPKPSNRYKVPSFQLGDDIEQILDEAARDGVKSWRTIAGVVIQIIDDWQEKNKRKAPVVAIRQKVGVKVGQGPDSIKEYHYGERDLGDFMDEVYPILVTLAHIRAMRKYAHHFGKTIQEVATWLLKISDDFGGQLAPPAWILAQCKNGDEKIPLVIRAIRGAAQNTATALRRCQGTAWEAMAQEFEDLANHAETVMEKAETIK